MPADDLDDLLRQAMKSLDDQVPSGYFEALPDRALARLEASMHSTGTGTSERGSASAAPPPAAQQEENSGLHDIRNLAQSTKQRLSSRRSTQNPIVEEDVLAASSAGWKAVALPAPAKMVSLPELDELPSKAEVRAKEKAAAKAAPAPAVEAPAAAPAARPAAPAPARRSGSSKGRTIALAGVGLAAAAGVAIFFAIQPKGEHPATATAPAPEATRATAVAAAAPAAMAGSAAAEDKKAEVAPAAPPAAEPATVDTTVATGATDGDEGATGNVAKPEPTRRHAVVTKAALDRGHDHDGKADQNADKTGKKDAAKDVKGAGSGSGSGSGESFDELLKEAGADKQQKVVKPRLAKKELTADDFKSGMDAVTSRAAACYKGTQGLANLSIVVAPSGHVAKVTVRGPFAGKPEGQCVIAAVRGATFPPWDGGPQTFVFPILLSE